MRSALLSVAVLAALAAGNPAALAQDAASGEDVFKRCTFCHAVGEDARNMVGPVLNDVFGRQAGTLEGFNYSASMVEAGEGGLVWSPETVDEFLAAPREFIPGTKMAFAGIDDAEDRANVVAYLLTFSPGYTPEDQTEPGEPTAAQ